MRVVTSVSGMPGRRFPCSGEVPALLEIDRHPEPGHHGETGDDGDRAAVADGVGSNPGQQAAGDVAHVAPEAVDADRRSPGDGRDCVGDRRNQGRIDERGADAEDGGGERR